MYELDIQYINKDIHQSLSSVHRISSKSLFNQICRSGSKQKWCVTYVDYISFHEQFATYIRFQHKDNSSLLKQRNISISFAIRSI